MCEECKDIENEVEEEENKKQKKEKIREVFIDDLPRKGKLVNWKESIGYKVRFIYDDIEGEIEIVGYDSITQKIIVKYKNIDNFPIFITNFTRGKIAGILKEKLYRHIYDESKPHRVDLRNLPLNGNGIDWYKVAGNKMFIPFVYDDIIAEAQVVDYDGKYLWIKYLDKEPYKINAGNFQNGQLAGLLGKKTSDFKIEIGTHYKDEKRDIIIIAREYRKDKNGRNRKMYKYHCNKCGFECGEHYKDGEYKEEHWVSESSLLNGTGCSCCSLNSLIVAEEINDIATTDPWMAKYFVNSQDAKKYTKGSHTKIKAKCPNCDRPKEKLICIKTIYSTHSIGCTCSDSFSYGHKYIFNLLTQLKRQFIENYIFDWCKFYNSYKQKEVKGEYDFILEDIKLIIEADGGWHREDNQLSGQTKEESKFLDDEKDKLARENGYEIIRISDEGDIKQNILDSDLTKTFDLSKIDWIKCEEFALSSRVREACEIKRDNPEMTTAKIGNIMKLDRSVIIRHLKKGSKIWDWINYNPKEEVRKGGSKAGKMKSKQIEIFKNGISLGIFSGGRELTRQSEELFGAKLNQGEISRVCSGIKKQYKGFTFKYVD